MMGTISYRSVVLLLLLAFAGIGLQAQTLSMTHYTAKDGLPSNMVYSMLSDSKGYLWLATDAGVSRFDGHRFTNYTLSDGLSDNDVMKVSEDSRGRIWFLGYAGTLSYYYKGRFHNPGNDSVLKKAAARITYLYFFEDKMHRLWFSNYAGYTIIDGSEVQQIAGLTDSIAGGGIVMNNDAGGVTLITPLPKIRLGVDGSFTFNGLAHKRRVPRYNTIAKSRPCYQPDGSMLFCADEGIVSQHDSSQRLILPISRLPPDVALLGVTTTSGRRMWVQTRNKGLLCFNDSDLSLPSRTYLDGKEVSQVTEDVEQNVWIGTLDDGIYMLPAGANSVTTYYCNDDKLHNIYSIAKDGAGNIYTGHTNGRIYVLTKGRSRQLFLAHAYAENDARDHIRINKLFFQGQDLWVGTDNYLAHERAAKDAISFVTLELPGVFSTSLQKMTPVRAVKDIAYTGTRIVVNTGNQVYEQNSPGAAGPSFNKLSDGSKRYYCVHVDKKGTIWYGTSAGLCSYTDNEEVNHAAESNLIATNIYDIAETADSVLVLASYGYGVLFYKDGRILHHLSEDSGLCSNLCRRLFIHRDHIYVATANGACRITYANGHIGAIQRYMQAEGLLSNSVNDIYADDSDICFATLNGLTILDPRSPAIRPGIPAVYITGIRSKGQLLSADSTYTFSHGQNPLQFTYTGISYRLPDDVLYQYRLWDEAKWMETKNTSIDFPSLAPGHYHFQLRARIMDGPWSIVRSVFFTIEPPFWRTYWFVSACALAFMIVVVLGAAYVLKVRRLRGQELLKVKEQITYLEQQALQAMMNPHFIFNVMNSIQHYINNNEKHEANLYLSNFATLIRMNLDISSKRYIPLDEEIAYLGLYFSLEGLRFGEKLAYELKVDDDIDRDETMIPVMLLQPFIENAIWHGILPKKGSGNVWVSISKEPNGMLKLTVTDNGVGIRNAAKDMPGIKTQASYGMKITQQRLDLIGRLTGHDLQIQVYPAFPDQQNTGTVVTFFLPGDLA